MESQTPSSDPSKRRRYSDEFKRDTVRLIAEENYSFKAASEAVGVCDQTLRAWYAKLAPKKDPSIEAESLLETENKQLRKKLREAEMERDILKKATAFFVKESQ
jgi:transposase